MSTRERNEQDERLEILQGTLDVLILRTLICGAQHGHGIVDSPVQVKSGRRPASSGDWTISPEEIDR